jgi:hypothetical protein
METCMLLCAYIAKYMSGRKTLRTNVVEKVKYTVYVQLSSVRKF